jgi:hypothetical protein
VSKVILGMTIDLLTFDNILLTMIGGIEREKRKEVVINDYARDKKRKKKEAIGQLVSLD